MQGVRNNFEDQHLFEQDLGLCGVFDGHNGDEAAAFCAERLHLHAGPAAAATAESLVAAFEACDAAMRGKLPEGSEAGSTACVVAVRERAGAFSLLVANCGDSRAVLVRRTDGGSVEATRDHRPGEPAERARIEAAGGFVSEEFDPPRVDGQLACSRALGAFKFKQDAKLKPPQQKVSSTPETYEWSAHSGDLLIVACDGIWDVFSTARVVEELTKTADLELGERASKLLELCLTKEADDNLTLMLIELGSVPAQEGAVSVTAGDFLKTKDKDVLEQYVSFCLRFGFALTKEMKPKSPPTAALAAVPAVPGVRYAALPKPPVVGGQGAGAAAQPAAAGAAAGGAARPPKQAKAAKAGYDYSGLKTGMKVQAESQGEWHKAEILQVSASKQRAGKPVKITYSGYDKSYDEWVGGARLKIKGKPVKKVDPSKPDRPPLEFVMGYWPIRGLGAPLRMIFEYRGAKYTEKRYDDTPQWSEDKQKLLDRNPLANLPYVQCGSDVVSQSNACLRYVGSRLRLNGAGDKARLQNEQLLCEIYDVRNTIVQLCYPFASVCRDVAEHKAKSVKHLEEGNPFGKFEAVLAKSGTDFFSGASICTADFHIWEMMDVHRLLAEKHGVSDIFANLPRCNAFYDKFRALPQLEKYFTSDAYKFPINGPSHMPACYFA